MTRLRIFLGLIILSALVLIGCASFERFDRDEPNKHYAASGYEGTTVVYELVQDRYTVVNPQRADKMLPPAGTFHILQSLVALETPAIRDENEVIPWDGKVRATDAWNRDHDLISAMKSSSEPFFQELTRRIGIERIQPWMARTSYGNAKVTPNPDTFWYEGNLRITPRQQTQFLARLATNDLPFTRRSMEITRRTLLAERTSDYTIYATTGWTDYPSHVGWYVGWIETAGGHLYTFATALESASPDAGFAEARIRVTREILKDMGVLPRVEMPRSDNLPPVNPN